MQQSSVNLIRQNSIYGNDKNSEEKIHLGDEKIKENFSILQCSNHCRKLIVNFSPACVLLGTPENEMQVISKLKVIYIYTYIY